MNRRLIGALLAGILIASPAYGYLHLTVNLDGRQQPLRWAATPRWFAADRGVPGVSASAMQATVARAFSTWRDLPSASADGTFGGFTGAEPFDEDGVSVIGFVDAPELERTLGATTFIVDVITGEIVEADIFFNAAFPWSTAAAGEAGRFDLESVALHEIGHFFGLGHSALGETTMQAAGGRRVTASGAVMFPVAFGRGITLDRQLQPDDIAGISDLYPDGDFRASTGTARGSVVRGSSGVLGAHILAYHLESSEIVAGFSLNEDGEFDIRGLKPGPHVIRVEPLDDADPSSFFDADVDVDFAPAFYQRLFVAPAGGVGDRFTATVPSR